MIRCLTETTTCVVAKTLVSIMYKGKHTEDLRIERKIHKSTKLVPTHTLTDQLIMKICRRVANQSRKIG